MKAEKCVYLSMRGQKIVRKICSNTPMGNTALSDEERVKNV